MGATHDWSREVDPDHLEAIREAPERYAPGGVVHLLLEVLAYPVDEVAHGAATAIRVTTHGDGSFSVGDDGRGTEMRYDASGRPARKPVMGTRDLRFFDRQDAPVLADGHPRSGISVVTALSAWLTHTTRRDGRCWVQRYERGTPVGPLSETSGRGGSGTTVRFRPDRAVFGRQRITAGSLEAWCARAAPTLDVRVAAEPPLDGGVDPQV